MRLQQRSSAYEAVAQLPRVRVRTETEQKQNRGRRETEQKLNRNWTEPAHMRVFTSKSNAKPKNIHCDFQGKKSVWVRFAQIFSSLACFRSWFQVLLACIGGCLGCWGLWGFSSCSGKIRELSENFENFQLKIFKFQRQKRAWNWNLQNSFHLREKGLLKAF